MAKRWIGLPQEMEVFFYDAKFADLLHRLATIEACSVSKPVSTDKIAYANPDSTTGLPVYINLRRAWYDNYFPQEPAKTVDALRQLCLTCGVTARVPSDLTTTATEKGIPMTPSGRSGSLLDYFNAEFNGRTFPKNYLFDKAEIDPMYVFFKNVALSFFLERLSCSNARRQS